MGRRDVGEVEVVAWTTPHMLEAILEPFVICGTIWPEESADASVGLVAKSSYDALAAAKDRCTCGDAIVTKLEARAEAAERQRDALREALDRSRIAIDDWLNTYASDHCSETRVKEAWERIMENGGTLAYIADVQQQNRAALKEEGK